MKAIPFSCFTILFLFREFTYSVIFVGNVDNIYYSSLCHARICGIFLLFFHFFDVFLHCSVWADYGKRTTSCGFFAFLLLVTARLQKNWYPNISLWYIRMPDSNYIHKYSHKINIYSLNCLNSNLSPLFSSHFGHPISPFTHLFMQLFCVLFFPMAK